MHYSHTSWAIVFLFPVQPVPHGSHQIGNNSEGRWVVVGPRKVVYPVVNLFIWVSRAFCSKLEYRPFFSMLLVKETDEVIDRISVGFLGPY